MNDFTANAETGGLQGVAQDFTNTPSNPRRMAPNDQTSGKIIDWEYPAGDRQGPPAPVYGTPVIIPQMGQSNARGNATIRVGIDDDYSGLEHILMYNANTDQLEPFRNPLPHQDVFANGTGFSLQFVRGLPKNRQYIIVPCAKGATGFGIHWNKGQPVYNEAVSRINRAFELAPGAEMGPVLWHQGETDANNQNTGYVNNWKTMRTNMIADITALTEDTVWVIGTIKESGDPWRAQINTYIEQIATDVAATRLVDLRDLPVLDASHFTAAALEEMGNRYYAALNQGLRLKKRFVFDSGTISTAEIGTQGSNINTYAAIYQKSSGAYVLRENIASDSVFPTLMDPITGKEASGLSTHYPKVSSFYTPGTDTHIALDVDFAHDDCFWANAAGNPAPNISGKWFILDTVIDSDSMYFSLNNHVPYIQIISSNGPSSWANWSLERTYGWKTDAGAAANNIKLRRPTGENAFCSDGVTRTLRIEVDTDNGGLEYHRMRIWLNGIVLHDHNTTTKNTDANGWFPIPPEFNLKGLRIYANNQDTTANAKDKLTDPTLYDGYIAGFEIHQYRLLEAS